MDTDSASEGRRTLALCMIVRDEEEFLPECLSFARDFVDEIVVVDTGSTDRTIEVAKNFGARVAEHPWCDDFSAARNYALDCTTADFVLVLDADERLGPRSGVYIRTLVDNEPEDAAPTVYLARFDNIDAQGNSMGGEYVPRLWRNDSEIRFVGRVHEQLEHATGELQYRLEDEFHVVHLGDDPEIAEARGKRERNLSLIRQALSVTPDDPYLRYQLSREQYAAGDYAQAMTGFRWVIEEGLASTLILNSYLFGSECLRAEGRPKEAMALALEGTEMAPDYGELWFTFARAALEAGERIKAHAGFQRATRTPSGLASIAFRDPSIADWRAVLGQAQALLSLQKVREATEVLTEARGRMPEAERVSTDLDLVKIYIQLGEPNEGWSLLKPLLEDRVDGAPLRLMELLELQLHSVGLTRTYDFIKGAMAVYPHLLDDLPLVIGALELAVANEDEISVFDLLRRAVDLGSPNREHYVLLARLLVERGEMEVARYVAECGRELPEPGEVE